MKYAILILIAISATGAFSAFACDSANSENNGSLTYNPADGEKSAQALLPREVASQP